MNLNISRPQIVVIWSALIIFIVFSLFVIAAEGDGLIAGIARTQAVLAPAAIFIAVLTALVVFTIGWAGDRPRPAIRWQNGLFRIYAVWAGISLGIVWFIAMEEYWDFVECLVPYACFALAPWLIHAITRWILMPIFRWIRSGFSPPVSV